MAKARTLAGLGAQSFRQQKSATLKPDRSTTAR